uniref:Vitellogenin domain-containing protein n=1 Tax=Sparus aurata TaxID=8175 RepID=A0A671V4W3_SPAAU
MRAFVLALTFYERRIFFAAGRTYVYKYETLLLGGLPEEGLAKAGLKISSKVHISAAAENIYLLKLVEPEIFELSGVWPKDPLIPAAKLTSALAAQLSTPIKFYSVSSPWISEVRVLHRAPSGTHPAHQDQQCADPGIVSEFFKNR